MRTSNCSHSFVTFNFESKDGTPITQCQASSSTCGQQLQDGMTCGCVLSASGFNHYHLIFEGKKDPYDEGKLTCSANCAPLPVDGAICKPLIFGEFHHLNNNSYIYVNQVKLINLYIMDLSDIVRHHIVYLFLI